MYKVPMFSHFYQRYLSRSLFLRTAVFCVRRQTNERNLTSGKFRRWQKVWWSVYWVMGDGMEGRAWRLGCVESFQTAWTLCKFLFALVALQNRFASFAKLFQSGTQKRLPHDFLVTSLKAAPIKFKWSSIVFIPMKSVVSPSVWPIKRSYRKNFLWTACC